MGIVEVNNWTIPDEAVPVLRSSSKYCTADNVHNQHVFFIQPLLPFSQGNDPSRHEICQPVNVEAYQK